MEWLKCIRFQSYNLNISIGKSVGYKCLYRWRMRSSDWSSLSLSNWVDGVGIDLISWIKSGWNQNLIHTRIFPLTLIRKIEKSRLEKNFTRYELGQFFEMKFIEWLPVIIDGSNQGEIRMNNCWIIQMQLLQLVPLINNQHEIALDSNLSKEKLWSRLCLTVKWGSNCWFWLLYLPRIEPLGRI